MEMRTLGRTGDNPVCLGTMMLGSWLPALRQVEAHGVEHAVDVQRQDRWGSGHAVVLPGQLRSGIIPARASVGTSTGTVSG
jgi:hypothetical protein